MVKISEEFKESLQQKPLMIRMLLILQNIRSFLRAEEIALSSMIENSSLDM